jgi:hypothetical protein
LWDEFAGKDAPPHNVAIALGMSPTSGTWRNLCGSAVAYGLVEGGYNATKMALTALGKRIVAPTSEGDDDGARVQAVLNPRIMNEFFRKYDRAKFPSDKIAENVLVELGLPKERAATARDILVKNGSAVGIIKSMKTGSFVALDEPGPSKRSDEDAEIAIPASDSVAPQDQATPPPGSDVAPRFVRSRMRSDSGPGYSLAPQQPLARGAKIDSYKLKQRLGGGFSAEVWSATVEDVPLGTELSKGQSVAMKFYHAHAMALPDQVLRVEREYRIAQSIRHPHLIRIYEFLLASPRPHHNFLVMDLARGVPLKRIIEGKQLSVEQTLAVFFQVLSALDELHGAGALHRDVKPGNIMVDLTPNVHSTLLDLGIVTITYEKGVTAVSHFLGSKHWAPYEQLMGEGLDERSDLYSAAAVAYNALTGHEPYAGSLTEAAVAVNMGKSALTLPSLKDIPDDIREMINACLSSRRENRPDSARDCLDVLLHYVNPEPKSAAASP